MTAGPRPLVALAAFALAAAVCACAQVPQSVCFAGEACADGGAGGPDGGTGGGTGGGVGGGSDGGSGGGAGGGSGGGTGGGGLTPVPDLLADAGVPPRWDLAQALFGPVQPAPPSFRARTVTLASSPGVTAQCAEAFRGAVALPDGRALAIPHCADRFAIIDPQRRSASWVGPVLPGSGLNIRHYGGAVLGCDLRVYALPFDRPLPEARVARVSLLADAGLVFDEVPLSLPAAGRFTGGVVGRPCSSGFRIIAVAGATFFALDVFQQRIEVSTADVLAASGADFLGVARVGDSQVLASPDGLNGAAVIPWIDADTLQVSTVMHSALLLPNEGVATRRHGDGFVISNQGAAAAVAPDGSELDYQEWSLAPADNLRWPTNLLDGWIVTRGSVLAAFSESSPPLDSGVAGAGTSALSGGLVLTVSGALVDVPGSDQSLDVTIYEPVDAGVPPAGLVLSPWFNKL